MTNNSTSRLTDAQKRARDWLPADGSWRTDPGRLAAALNSLSRAWPGCVESEWANCGLNWGRKTRWRLTVRGVDVRAGSLV
jgi:hypothetical protein